MAKAPYSFIARSSILPAGLDGIGWPCPASWPACPVPRYGTARPVPIAPRVRRVFSRPVFI